MLRLARTTALAVALGVAFTAGLTLGSGPREDPAGGASLDDVADRIAAEAADPVSRSDLDQAAVRGMLDALDDRWATYYAAGDYAEFRDRLDGFYTGVGLWLQRSADRRIVVTSVTPGSSAAAAGLRPGDQIVSVAGRAVGGRELADIVGLLRGAAGSRVGVVVESATGRRLLSLRRDPVPARDVTMRLTAAASGVAGSRVAVVRVAAITAGSGRDVRRAVASARRSRVVGVVLDLRGNPGGLLHEAVEVASVFLADGPVVSYTRRDEPPRVLPALGDGDETIPVAVLVDGGTASAAEIVAGALQDRRRGVVVGSRTFGKGSVQESQQLGDGAALELTVARFVTPEGRAIDGVGLEPDIEVAPGVEPAVALRRAVDVLSGLSADAGPVPAAGAG